MRTWSVVHLLCTEQLSVEGSSVLVASGLCEIRRLDYKFWWYAEQGRILGLAAQANMPVEVSTVHQ